MSVVLLLLAVPALAQEQAAGPHRSGFTALLSLGLGYQVDTTFEESESAVGLGGLNLGLGGFVSSNLAVMFRVSGTNVKYNFDVLGQELDFSQVSGVGGVTVQYWVNDRFNIEGGPGLGFWSTDGSEDTGFGLVVAGGYSIFRTTKTNLQVGVEWAPAFVEGGSVQNLGFNLGFQFL